MSKSMLNEEEIKDTNEKVRLEFLVSFLLDNEEITIT